MLNTYIYLIRYREAYIKELESIGLLPSKLTLSALNNETTTAAAVVHNGVVVVPPASAFDKSFRAAYKHMFVNTCYILYYDTVCFLMLVIFII